MCMRLDYNNINQIWLCFLIHQIDSQLLRRVTSVWTPDQKKRNSNREAKYQENTYRRADVKEVYKPSKMHVHSHNLPVFTEIPHLASGDEQTETESAVS
jgi:hypothetical protein